MKVLNCKKPWPSKVNFIDENNVALGYDLSQSCCEDAGWFIADTICNEVQPMADSEPDLTGYVFDTSFIKRDIEGADFDGGGIVAFRITNGTDEKFIHLYNNHNGYYSHGFEFVAGDASINDCI